MLLVLNAVLTKKRTFEIKSFPKHPCLGRICMPHSLTQANLSAINRGSKGFKGVTFNSLSFKDIDNIPFNSFEYDQGSTHNF